MKYILLFIPYLLFSNSISNDFINDFKYKPYNETIQIETLQKIKENNYKGSSELISLLKDVYIYAKDENIATEALSLFNNEDYVSDISWINRKGELVTKKISEKDFKKRLESIKKKDSFNYKNLLFTKKTNNFQESLLTDLEKRNNNKVLEAEDTYYRLIYYLENKDIKEAETVFLGFVKKFYEARFNSNREITKISNFTKYASGDIYTIGAFINYNNKDYDKYRERALYFYESNPERFDVLMAELMKFNEMYVEATYHYENIKNKDFYIKEFLLESYQLASKKALLNNEHSVSWVNARKGLLLIDEMLENKKNKNIKHLLEMKNTLSLVSSHYVQELSSKGQIKHSRDIREETSKLLNKKIL